MRLSKLFLWALAAAIGLTLIAPLLGFMLPMFAMQPDMLFGSGLTVMAGVGVALGCSSVRENGRAPILMLSGVVIGLAAAGGWVATYWLVSSMDIFYWVTLLTWPSAWAGFVMVTGVLLLVRMQRTWQHCLRWATIALLAVLGLQISLGMSLHPDHDLTAPVRNAWDYEQKAIRTGLTIGILAAGGVVTTLVGAWFVAVTARPTQHDYWIRCPRCAREQTLRTGVASCAGCGLAIRLELS